jgi:hypothetical protein
MSAALTSIEVSNTDIGQATMTAPLTQVDQAINLLDDAIAAINGQGATLSATADLAVLAHKLRRVSVQLPRQIADGRSDRCNGCRYYGETVSHLPYGDRDAYRIGSNCAATTPHLCPIVRDCAGEF